MSEFPYYISDKTKKKILERTSKMNLDENAVKTIKEAIEKNLVI